MAGGRITDQTTARLGRLLFESPTFVQRCTERISFLAIGGQRWVRAVQLRVPPLTLLDDERPDEWHVISLGTFQRRRFPDFVVTDAAGHRVTLLTRQEHGEVLAKTVLSTYLLALLPVPDAQSLIAEDRTARRLYQDLVRLTSDMFTTVGRTIDPYAMQDEGALLSSFYANNEEYFTTVNLLIWALGLRAGEISEEIKAFARTLVQLEGVTQYLCWVRASPGDVVTLEATYTTSDARMNADYLGRREREAYFASVGDSSRPLPRVLRWVAGRYRQLGMAPLNYAFRTPGREHANSYYFSIEPPERSVVTFVASGGADVDLDSAYPSVHSHNGVSGDDSSLGNNVYAYLRSDMRDHKRIALAAAMNLLFLVLIGVGRFGARSGTSPQALLVLAPTILTALIIEQQRHYYAVATRRQRGVLWSYLAVSLAFLTVIAFSLATAPGSDAEWGDLAVGAAVVFSTFSAAMAVGYLPIGRMFATRTKRRVDRVMNGSTASGSARVDRERRSYDYAVVRYCSIVVLFVLLGAAGAGVGTYHVWQDGSAVAPELRESPAQRDVTIMIPISVGDTSPPPGTSRRRSGR